MKKRIVSLFCAIVLLSALLTSLSALAEGLYAYVYTGNGKTLNMRKAPVTNANNKIMNIPYGARVLINSYVNGKTWAYIEYDGKLGYVMTRYLVFSEPAPKPSDSSGTKGSEINYSGFVQAEYNALVRPSAPGGWVNLRWAPSKTVAVHEKLHDGQHLEVIAQDASWAQVRDPSTGVVGFVSLAFLTKLGD